MRERESGTDLEAGVDNPALALREHRASATRVYSENTQHALRRMKHDGTHATPC